jgi:hypothetical protein
LGAFDDEPAGYVEGEGLPLPRRGAALGVAQDAISHAEEELAAD